MKKTNKIFVVAVAVAGLAVLGTGTAFAGKKSKPICPQDRSKTNKASAEEAKLDKTSPDKVAAGKLLFTKTAKPMACKMCHGVKGDGTGIAGAAFAAMGRPPRNFTCKETVKDITAGQMFHVIKNGSSPMMAFGKKLKDDQIWEVISYVRSELMAK